MSLQQFTAIAALLLAAAGRGSADEPSNLKHDAPGAPPALRRVVIIAHRGAHEEAPENTLPAFRKAIELGCDYVEMDVRQTKDRRLVIMHDPTVDRTTNGTGRVEDLTLARIREFDAGVKWGPAWAGLQAPTLDEALAACRDKIKVYVDYKDGAPAEVIAAIEKQRMLQDVAIYGSVERLHEIKRLRPGVRIICAHPGAPDKFPALMKELKPEILDGHVLSWSREQVRAAHRGGAQVWPDALGPLDGPLSYHLILYLGADAIQTDYPGALLAMFKAAGRRP